MSFNDLPETFAIDPVAAEHVQQMMQESLTKHRQTTRVGQVAAPQQVEINPVEAFPDGHYSGSPDFDPKVFGAD
jgi:hypothetical protein